MARKKRMESIGFYHILNRGVERRKIYMDDEDHEVFLEILQESAEVYQFELYAYVLMDNHYHLLLKTSALNLSLLMRQINARYSIYFNKKYKRVGPLWQGRFKSWYVYDQGYLQSLVKYIEFNPIKAKMVQKIGQFRWAMSSKEDILSACNYELIDSIDLHKPLSELELQKINDVHSAKLMVLDASVVPKIKAKLEEHFCNKSREVAIAEAIKDGYKQIEIAGYLGLSSVAISLLKHFKKVYTKTSGMGMEALILGLDVVCYGMPYYAGWGVTQDKQHCKRRTRPLQVEELFAGAYILYTRYHNPYTRKPSDIIDTIYEIIKRKKML